MLSINVAIEIDEHGNDRRTKYDNTDRLNNLT